MILFKFFPSRDRERAGVVMACAFLSAMCWSGVAASQQAPSSEKSTGATQPALAKSLVQIPQEDLERLAALEAEVIELRKTNDELRRRPLVTPVGPTGGPNLAGLKTLFEQQAQRFGEAVGRAVFCSAVTTKVDDNFIVDIDGKARGADDAEKIRAVLEADSFYALLKASGLVRTRTQVDGGQAGGCVVEMATGLTVTKETAEDFATPMHSELTDLKGVTASIPDKARCAEIGQAMSQFRNDSGRVPVRKRNSFTAFWVRDGDDFTLCREDGGDWRAASKLMVKPSWEGILVLSKQPK